MPTGAKLEADLTAAAPGASPEKLRASVAAASASHAVHGPPTTSLQLAGLPQELQELFKRIDVDSNGSVHWEEFLAFALLSGADYDSVEHLWQQLLQGRSTAIAAESFQGSSNAVLLEDKTWTLHFPNRSIMEDAVRIRYMYVKASGVRLSSQEVGDLEYVKNTGGDREVTLQVGKVDNKGKVTLHSELTDLLFVSHTCGGTGALTIKGDPFNEVQAKKGVRVVEVNLHSSNETGRRHEAEEAGEEGQEEEEEEGEEEEEEEEEEMGGRLDQPQKVDLELHFSYCLEAGCRVRLPFPEESSPCYATVMHVKPGDMPGDSIVCAMDNSDKQVEVSHSRPTTIQVCANLQRATGQRLMVLHEGKLTDAIVIAPPSGSKPARHRLSLLTGAEIELDLNEFNHCVQRLESASAYEAARVSFCENLCNACATVQDAITGTQLRVEDQTLQIKPNYSRGVQRDKWVSAATIKDLAPLLLEPSSNRLCGAHEALPALIEAPPGTGKTWSSYQLGHSLATAAAKTSNHGPNLVPVLMFVQRLARLLKIYGSGRELSLHIVFHYLVLEYGAKPEWLMMLAMAFEMRAAVVVLDGIDEASGRRDDVQDLVLNVLVRMGQRLITTSRPEGVRLERFRTTFVIIGLEPLSEEQAQDAIKQQMQFLHTGREFTQNLLDFQRIRKEHDRIWTQDAFPSHAERAKVEALSSPDRFHLATPPSDAHKDTDGEVYDPAMRQLCADGSRVIQQRQGTVRSKFWKELTVLLEPVLRDLDGVVERLGKQATVEEVEAACEALLRSGPITSCRRDGNLLSQTLARKLCLVARGENTVPSLLANVIRERTDELYEAVEELQPLFELVMAAALRGAGMDPDKVAVTLQSGKEIKTLTLASGLKDPVRIYEKARDDYAQRFNDAGLPEACVADVLRARAVCEEGSQQLALQELLGSSFKIRVEGEGNAVREVKTGGELVTLELVRTKNKCSSNSLDPTHFRNFLNNLRMVRGNKMAFVELQVHHARILAHNEDAHAHGPYEYFRSILGGSYGPKLNTLLERVIVFMEEVFHTPVLLSMLILCFTHRKEGSGLPASLLELYLTATSAALRTATLENATALDVMRRVATANMVAQGGVQREFTSDDLNEILGDEGLAVWERLRAADGGLPLIKTLEQKTVSRPAMYQFRHLSFQEALYAMHLVDGGAATWAGWKDDQAAFNSLKEPSLRNVLRIGGGALGSALGYVRDRWNFSNMKLGDTRLQALVGLLQDNTALESRLSLKGSFRISNSDGVAISKVLDVNMLALVELDLSQNDIGDVGAEAVGKALKGNASLTMLYLDRNSIGDVGATALGKALTVNASLKTLELGSNKIGDAGAAAIADALRVNASLKTLYLSTNKIGNAGAAAIADALRVNASLKELNLINNQIGDAGAAAIADALRVNASLSELGLDGNSIAVGGAKVLASALEVNASMTILGIGENKIGDAGATVIADALRVNASLTELRLFSNNVGDEGAIALGKALGVNASLTELRLFSNNIGDEGAIALGKALGVNASLTELSLYGNNIGDEGAITLCNALAVNASLTWLGLSGNNIGDAGAAAIAEALRVNASLEVLSLAVNEIGPSGATAIAEALKVNASLKTLNLNYNEIGDAGAAGIADVLSVNASLKLEKLVVPVGLKEHMGLVAACKAKGVELD